MVLVVSCAVWVVVGIKLVGVPQPKSMYESRLCLMQEDLELFKFWGYLWQWQHLRFLGVKFCIPQPKHMHGFPPNFCHMFIPRGSIAD